MCRNMMLLVVLVVFISQCESFYNPVLTGPDVSRPSVINYKGAFFMITNNLDLEGNGFWFPIHQSSNLQNWTRVAYAFNTFVHPTWTDSEYYISPSLHYREETDEFILLFNGINGYYKVGAAKSKSIYGPYIPEAEPLEFEIQSNHWYPRIMSYDGESYVLFEATSVIQAKKINLDSLTLYNEASIVLITPTLDWEKEIVIAPNYFRLNDQHYILYTTAGGCLGGGQDSTAIGVAKSPNLLGPYTKLGSPLLNSTLSNIWATGNGNIVNDTNTNTDAIVYAGIPIGADDCKPPEVHVNYIEWDADGWPHVLTE